MTRDQLIDIARCGILAPSADNRHVFRIELSDSVIRLWPSTDFAATMGQLRRVLGLISLGAAVENMRLRTLELGLSARIEWFLQDGNGPIVELALESVAAPQPDDLASVIASRHTNRRMYRGPAPSADERGQLAAAVDAVEGARLVWLEGKARRRALGMIWRAESERFLRRTLHEDLFNSIRFDLSWTDEATEGLPPGALEVEAPMRPLFKALRHWGVMRPLNWIGVHRLLGVRAGLLPAWQAPALGVVATTLPLESGATAVGAALERLWLRATALDLCLQPMAASVVLPLQSSTDVGASDKLRSALSAGWRGILPAGVTPLTVFRMGRAAAPSMTAKRLTLEHYLVAGRHV